MFFLLCFYTENPLNTWSQRRDSNPRPTDYKSVALPAELRWHMINFKDQQKLTAQNIVSQKNWYF
jgi:hypothetical protein